MIRVLVVHEDPHFPDAVRGALDYAPDIDVVAETSDCMTALELATACRPDVVLMESAMLGEDQLQLVGQLTSAAHDGRVVLVSVGTDESLALEALRRGAWGHAVRVRNDIPDLIRIIRTVHGGGSILSTRLTAALIDILYKEERAPRQSS